MRNLTTFTLLFLVFSLTFLQTLRAQSTTTTVIEDDTSPIVQVPIVEDECYRSHHRHRHVPQHFSYNGMLYDFSMKGLKYLMNDIRVDSPEAYRQILPHYSQMKKNITTAYVLIGSSAAVGGALVISGMTAGPDVDDEDFGERLDEGTGQIFVGIGIALAGTGIAALIAPNKQDIFTILNVNNRYNQKGKIRWNMGYDYVAHVPKFGLTYNF